MSLIVLYVGFKYFYATGNKLKFLGPEVSFAATSFTYFSFLNVDAMLVVPQ